MEDRHLAALIALGQIESDLGAITELDRRLEQVPLWLPGAVLRKQVAEGRRLIDGIHSRMDRRLVVTLIGPSGAGKSTLLNALAGVDDLSSVGIRRPTTQVPVVLSDDPDVAASVLEGLNRDGIRVQVRPGAKALEHLVLVDTPDTDSMDRESHQDLLLPLVERSDVLLCVFDAQNPKRRDHADFMAPLVKRFHGASIVAVVNKCDRLPADELSRSVGPDFDAYLQSAWETRPQVVLLISARSNLHHPGWDPQAEPLHKLDQFEQLRELIQTAFAKAGFGQDRRAANARRIRDFILAQAARTAQEHLPKLDQANTKMANAGKTAMQKALEGLRRDNGPPVFGVNVRLYQALAQRWLGPVGWLVAIWSRLVVFGSGLTALVRFGNPIHQIWGLFSSWKRFKESRAALSALKDDTRVNHALQAFRKAILVQWPDIAELMIAGGFDPQVRDGNIDESQQVGRDLDALWADRLDAQIESFSKSLSGFWLQAVFNLPSLALMGYVGWLTARSFFQAQYLTSDFFLHALLTIVLVLLLSFFLLQVLVRLVVGRDRIQRRAFKQVEAVVVAQPLALSTSLSMQIDRIGELASLGETNSRLDAKSSDLEI
jgi:energy-coupling factor transporter ATP-binding protein EcfA2